MKYVYEREDKSGDVFEMYFDTKEEAIRESRYFWDHLTRSEKKRVVSAIVWGIDDEGVAYLEKVIDWKEMEEK